MKKSGVFTISLLLLHLVIVSGLFASRYSFDDDWKLTGRLQKQLEGGETGGSLHVSPWVAIRHYFSQPGDEANFYEIATVMLGRSIEPGYVGHAKRRGGRGLGIDLTTVNSPKIPYRDFTFEYPPLLLIPIVLPALVTTTSLGYIRVFAFLVGAAVVGSLLLLLKFPAKRKLPVRQTLWVSLGVTFSFGVILATRLDIFPAFLTLLALFLYEKKRSGVAAFVLACAVMCKA